MKAVYFVIRHTHTQQGRGFVLGLGPEDDQVAWSELLEQYMHTEFGATKIRFHLNFCVLPPNGPEKLTIAALISSQICVHYGARHLCRFGCEEIIYENFSTRLKYLQATTMPNLSLTPS